MFKSILVVKKVYIKINRSTGISNAISKPNSFHSQLHLREWMNHKIILLPFVELILVYRENMLFVSIIKNLIVHCNLCWTCLSITLKCWSVSANNPRQGWPLHNTHSKDKSVHLNTCIEIILTDTDHEYICRFMPRF